MDSGAGRLGWLGSGNQLGPARTGQEMVPLALPARSLDWGSTRDTLYLKSLEFPCDASSCDDTRVPVFMREDRNQTRESSLTCIPALLGSSNPEVFFTHSLPAQVSPF